MASNASNAAALAAHREAFPRAFNEHYDKLHGSHVHIKTEHEYEQLVTFLKGPGPKDKNSKKTKWQYYAMENYVVMNGTRVYNPRTNGGQGGGSRRPREGSI
jgi:hypothetical protein